MFKISTYSPIFFDFDGLLVNTEHLHYQAYQNTLEKHGVAFPWSFLEFAAVAHKSSEGLRHMITAHASELVEQESWEKLYEQKKAAYQQILEYGRLELMPGAQEILALIQQTHIPHAVVTNSTRLQTNLIREKIPVLNVIPHWITREDYKNPKPAPDAYLKAIKILGKSDQMLGFEDTLRGVQALQGAGIIPILICPYDHPQMEDISGSSLKHFPSLTAFLLELKIAFV